MPDQLTREFPLFPLGIVALPGELMPLHIFEDRYKTMMNECLRDEKEFGIVWLADDGLRETGCACAIDRVLELRSENARVRLFARVYHAAVERPDLIDRAQERARSNGKVRFGA